MAVKPRGLGKGLSSLMEENFEESAVTEVMLSQIEPNRDQPRKDFDEEALCELSESIKKHGLLQPILVRSKPTGGYEIIAGERRWRACRMAELRTVPVVIREMDEREVMEVALIENLQREDLNPIEEALGYRSLMVSYSLTQEQIAEAMGKSRSAVANTLRLLELSPEETEALKKGKLSAGAARVLLSAPKGSELRSTLFRLAIGGASVRDLETAAKERKNSPPRQKLDKPTFYKEVEISLKNELGRKVKVTPTAKGKGTITLEFYSDEELAELVKKIAD